MFGNVNHFKKTHAINSWLNLVLSCLVVVLVFISLVINLLAQPTELVEEVGVKTFRMFTVLSNMFVSITTAMTIPFAVDGIRQKNYHLPRWIVNLNFVSVSCITLTFLVTLCLLAPRAGFGVMMLEGNNLFLHTIIPITTITVLLFINTYHNIKFKATLFALIPVTVYAAIYFVSAIVIGEDNGGWRDHYHFIELMPWYYALILILLMTFGIANLLRAVHNRMHRLDKIATEKYYQGTDEYDLPTIEEAIKKLAIENKQYDMDGEVIVPRRIIKMLEKKYQSNLPIADLCGIYLNEYLNASQSIPTQEELCEKNP